MNLNKIMINKDQETKICPRCFKQVSLNTEICPNCLYVFDAEITKFEDLETNNTNYKPLNS